MKKLLISLLCLLCLSTVGVNAEESLPEITEHEKVTIYIFRGNGCDFCKKALTFFNENAKDYADYFEVKSYEVWENSNNSSLMDAVASKLGDKVNGVPYIVIGDSYSENGFNEELGKEMIATALKEYQNEKYTDVVAEVAKDFKKLNQTSLYEACVEDGIIVKERDKSKDTIIVLGIFAVIIGGGVALVVFSRKK